MSVKQEKMEWFIRQVAEGTSGLDANDIRQMATKLQPDLLLNKHFCIAIWFQDQSCMDENAEMPMRLLEACKIVLKQACPEAICYIGSQFRIVMAIAEREQGRADLVQKLHKTIARHIGTSIRIGVGKSYVELDKLSYSRAEAYEALNSGQTYSGIFYIDDIYANRSSTTRKLEGEKRLVIEQFKAGQLNQMMTNMVVLAENIRKESPAREGMPYPTSIRRTILEILFEIMHISADIGVDVEGLLNYQDPYSRVFEIEETPEILSWFQGIAAQLYESIDEISRKSEKNMLSLAKKQIAAHISNSELSLTFISNALGITPSYFSAFFIREMNIGFQEYVTDLRMQRAKTLLKETNQKISQIAIECGFSSTSYFINVFRKQTGLSPNVYRNMK